MNEPVGCWCVVKKPMVEEPELILTDLEDNKGCSSISSI